MVDALYYYYIHLTEIKGMEHATVINLIADQYTACKTSGVCSLDSEFINSQDAVTKAISAANQIIEEYLKLKMESDATVAHVYQWYEDSVKGKIETIFSLKGVVKTGAEFFFPGAAGSVIDKIPSQETVFDVINSAFDKADLKKSQEARTKIELLETNLAHKYTAATPSVADNVEKIRQLMENSIYNKTINTFTNHFKTLRLARDSVDSHLLNLDFMDYIHHEHVGLGKEFTHPEFSWITQKAGTDHGIFDTALNDARVNALTWLTSNDNIKQLADAVATTLQTQPKENVNIIEQTQLYNDFLINMMEKTIEAVQASMYLDSIVLSLRASEYANDWKGTLNYAYTTLGDVTLTQDYNTNLSDMLHTYQFMIDLIQMNYKKYIKPERQFVAENVLETVQNQGKCIITGTDGLDSLSATCPEYGVNEFGIAKVKYHKTSLSKSGDKCLTVHQNGEGDITQIADVRNIYGRLACLINKSVATTQFSALNNWTMQSAPLAGHQTKYTNYDSKLNKVTEMKSDGVGIRYFFVGASSLMPLETANQQANNSRNGFVIVKDKYNNQIPIHYKLGTDSGPKLVWYDIGQYSTYSMNNNGLKINGIERLILAPQLEEQKAVWGPTLPILNIDDYFSLRISDADVAKQYSIVKSNQKTILNCHKDGSTHSMLAGISDHDTLLCRDDEQNFKRYFNESAEIDYAASKLATTWDHDSSSHVHTIYIDKARTKVYAEDWASGWLKRECPENSMVTGIDPKTQNVMCSPLKSRQKLSNICRLTWIYKQDSDTNFGMFGHDAVADWAPYETKARILDNEYIAGVAFSYPQHGGAPAAVMICSLNSKYLPRI